MIKDLRVSGYRGIRELEMRDFGKVNLLVGKNNSGKSSVLECLALLTRPLSQSTLFSLNRLRAITTADEWSLFFHNFDEGTPVLVSGNMSLGEHVEGRALTIFPLAMSDESLSSSKRVPLVMDELDERHTERGFVMHVSISKDGIEHYYAKKVVNGNGEVEFEEYGDKQVYSNINSMMVTPSGLKELKYVFELVQREKKLDPIVTVLRKIEPSLIELRLGTQGIYCDIGLHRLVPVNVMGQGFVWLLRALLGMSVAQNGVAVIDEVDNGLHYSAQQILWKAIFEAVEVLNVQIFATTHSEECVRAFGTLEHPLAEQDQLRLYRIEKGDNKHRAVLYDRDILQASLESDWEVR